MLKGKFILCKTMIYLYNSEADIRPQMLTMVKIPKLDEIFS